MKKYTSDDIKRIIELYNEGLSQRQVAAKVGCSQSFVKITLHDCKVQQRTKAFYAKSFDAETETRIINDYYSGSSIRDLANKYGSSTMPIVNLFKRHNLKFRDLSHSIRTYDIDENYFDDVDSPNKAYILGFLYADGANVSDYEHGHYLISLTIHSKDKHILNDMRKEMKMESGIFEIHNKDSDATYVQIRICNKRLALRLYDLGVTPRKSLTTIFPEWMPDELVPHFIRGIFDGDGSIASDLQYANICGSDSLCSSISNVIYNKLGFAPLMYPHNTTNGISVMVICKKYDKLKFLNWIYQDADLKLQRKYNLYQQFLSKLAS